MSCMSGRRAQGYGAPSFISEPLFLSTRSPPTEDMLLQDCDSVALFLLFSCLSLTHWGLFYQGEAEVQLV